MTGKKFIRADELLFSRGLVSNLDEARNVIMSGAVRINGETVKSPSVKIKLLPEASVEIKHKYFVSRGGIKLDHALSFFEIDVRGLTALDLGASSGGFTDCLLKRGASLVYAVDVGYGQFDYSLRNDSRVVLKERTNVMELGSGSFERKVDFVCADLSFISIVRVYPLIRELLPQAAGLLLIKPQFEAFEEELDRGVVKEQKNLVAILTRVLKSLFELDIPFSGLTASPLKGPAGNAEFFLYFSTAESLSLPEEPAIIVQNALSRGFKNIC